MSKFAEIETGYSLTPFESLNRPPRLIPKPRNVVCTPRLISGTDATSSYTLDISWDFPVTLLGRREAWITSYLVQFRRGLRGAWGSEQEVTTQYARYENVGSGRFFARARSVCAANGKKSLWTVSGQGTLSSVHAIADASSANYSYFVTEF